MFLCQFTSMTNSNRSKMRKVQDNASVDKHSLFMIRRSRLDLCNSWIYQMAFDLTFMNEQL